MFINKLAHDLRVYSMYLQKAVACIATKMSFGDLIISNLALQQLLPVPPPIPEKQRRDDLVEHSLSRPSVGLLQLASEENMQEEPLVAAGKTARQETLGVTIQETRQSLVAAKRPSPL